MEQIKAQLTERTKTIETLSKKSEEYNAKTVKMIEEKEQTDQELKNAHEQIATLFSQKEVLYEQIKKLKEENLVSTALANRMEKQINEMKTMGIRSNIELDAVREEPIKLMRRLGKPMRRKSGMSLN